MSSSKHTPGVVSLGDALTAFMRESGTEQKVRAQQVILEWENAVGTSIARAATPVKIADGVLTVKAKNAVWRTELLMRRTELMQKVNEYFKSALVTAVVIR